MLNDRIFLASTGYSLVRASKVDGHWFVKHSLRGMKINSIVPVPGSLKSVIIGTQDEGVLLSKDGGRRWRSIGLNRVPVKALAVNPRQPQTIYAGCKPVRIFMTENLGSTWQELPGIRRSRKWWWFSPADPPGMTPYVNALAVSPNDPNVLLAGIELGAVMRSEDGGRTWSKHLKGADRDCHSLMFHPKDGRWVYEGGGMHGVSMSTDHGRTWQKPRKGLGSKYGWAVAADPEHPEIWYLSASIMPRLWRGEFEPPAHKDGQAHAHIFRRVGDSPWEQLSGGLPEPLDYLPYALVTVKNETGHVFAGMANGEVWHSGDFGDNWICLPFNLGAVHGPMVVI